MSDTSDDMAAWAALYEVSALYQTHRERERANLQKQSSQKGIVNMSVASITVVGRLGKDPEVKMTQAGKQLVTASVAVSAGKDKPSTWFNIIAFENMGKWLVGSQKGDMIFVQGDLEFKTYEKKDGTIGYDHSVYARTIRAMSKREPSPQFSNDRPGGEPSTRDFDFDQDVPFHHAQRRSDYMSLLERAMVTL